MPGKSGMLQGDVAALSHREPRRSEPMLAGSVLGHASARAPRASVHTGSENVTLTAGGRRSPRIGGSAAATTQSRLARTSAAPRVSGALSDITNVSAARALQAYGKIGKQSATGQATVAAPERALPMPPPVVAGSRTLSTQGTGDVQPHIPAPVAPPASSTDTNPFQGDGENPQSVHEYAAEIFGQLFRDEAAFLPRPNYMEAQTDINGKMRAILIDWLIEVHMKYRLRPETLFLTVNLIDRYLSRTHVMRKKLQLAGVVAMFIAAKFEEIHPPEVHDFVHITDNAYSKTDILQMECAMLTTLSFQIVIPTAAHFFERLQKANQCDEVHREIAEYLLELGLLDMRMLRYPPSHAVSAALLLSNELQGRRVVWPQNMVQYSRHTEQALRGCAEEYRELLEASPKAQLQAVQKKFSLPQRHSVARMNF